MTLWRRCALRSADRGAALGAGDAAHAKLVAWRVTAFSTIAGGMLAGVFGAGAAVLPRLFTADRSVLAAISVPWWFMVAQLPFAAGEAAFMRTATVVSALVGCG